MHFLLGWPSTWKLPSFPSAAAGTAVNSSQLPHSSQHATTSHESPASQPYVTEPIRHLAYSVNRTKVAVVTDTAVYLFHFQQCDGMCVGIWRRSPSSLSVEGPNSLALFSPDECKLAVTTSHNVINILSLFDLSQKDANNAVNRSSNNVSSRVVTVGASHSVQVCSFPEAEWHDEATLNAPLFYPIHLQLQSRVKLANDSITCASVFDDEIVLGTRSGYIQVVSWDGQARICVDALTTASPLSASATPATANPDATPIQSPASTPAIKPSLMQITYNSSLGLIAFVFDDGSVGIVDSAVLRITSASSAPQLTDGILLLHGNAQNSERATRVSFNAPYNLIAVGLQNGDVAVYRIDRHSVSLRCLFLRTYSISRWGFQANEVGYVRCLEWSEDGSVVAVGWSNRGLVIWSTRGTRVACTLPLLSSTASTAPSTTPTPLVRSRSLNPTTPATSSHSTELLANGVTALIWGAGGGSLLLSSRCSDSTQEANDGSASPSSHHSLDSSCGCGLLTRLSLTHSAVGSNPSQNESTSLVLLGDDRFVVWAGKRHSASLEVEEEANDDILAANWVAVEGKEDTSHHAVLKRKNSSANLLLDQDRMNESDGDWEHILFPSVYLSHAWPIKHCALSASGSQVACAGKQGLICLNRLNAMNDRKWRRFGNMSHESLVQAKGIAWYGEHIVCIASAGQHEQHRLPGRTSFYDPPPPSSANAKINQNWKKQQASASAPTTGTAQSDSIELLFFPRNHLDNASLLHAHVLSHASSFHSIDISDHTLMVYLSVGQVLIYQLRAEVHSLNTSHKNQAAMSHQQLLLSKLGIQAPSSNAAAAAPLPYSTLPHAHEPLGIDQELRMTLDLCYVVDLCAPLRPMRDMSHFEANHADLVSLNAMLATPPLQCRLWLSSADSVDEQQASTPIQTVPVVAEDASNATSVPPTSSSPSTSPPTSSVVLDGSDSQVYELPLFCPTNLSQGLEALHHATKGRANAKAAASANQNAEVVSTASLTCIILTATGTLLAIDIGPSAAKAAGVFSPANHVTSPLSPSSSLFGFSSSNPQNTKAWARIVSSDVEQVWLHEMSSLDPFQAASQYLHVNRLARESVVPSTSLAAAASSSIHPPSAPSLTPSPSYFSFSQSKKRLRGLRLFSYGAEGLKVWFRLTASEDGLTPPNFQSTSLLDFDPEVYPLGLDSNIGVIVGITKGLRTKSMFASQFARNTSDPSGAFPEGTDSSSISTLASPFWGPVVCFRLQTKLQPYLHGVLMHLIAKTGADVFPSDTIGGGEAGEDDFNYAFELANSCRSHSYFLVSLELLLHTALNPSTSTSTTTIEPSPSASSTTNSTRMSRQMRDKILARIVRFLRQFPEFPDVVMNVARKNDSSCWARLFAQAGAPADLFQLCLQAGKLRMASCYLVVIQRTDGMVKARQHAKMVLEKMGVSDSHDSTSHAPHRFSALEGELRRYIALTHGMEQEEKMMLTAQAEAERAKAIMQQKSAHSTPTQPPRSAGVAATPSQKQSEPHGASPAQQSHPHATPHNAAATHHPNPHSHEQAADGEADANGGGCNVM